MKAYEWAFKNRKNLDFVNGTIKNQLVKTNKNVLGSEKEFPVFAKIHLVCVEIKFKIIVMLSNTCKYALRALIYLGKYSEEIHGLVLKKFQKIYSYHLLFWEKFFKIW
jgi:hypothetical protein